MDIVIVAEYLCDLEDIENQNSRFIYLGELIRKTENNVEIITSDFHHSKKEHFKNVPSTYKDIKLTLCHEPGYPKNICLKRFYSHNKLSTNLYKYLSNRKLPDIIYCAIPSLDVAYKVSKFCKKNNIKFIIDIQDLWPEAFKMVFNVPIISNLIFYPMKLEANYIYKNATNIVAVSQTYVDRGLKVNKKIDNGLAVYLGTKLCDFDKCSCKEDKDDNIFKIGYCGSISDSYDLGCIINAINKAFGNNNKLIKLIVMGDGYLRNKYENMAKELNINYEFTGMLPYPEMVHNLTQCHIAVNPIKKGSAGSIINKVGDYAMAGLPVVNTQECKEYRELLEKYNCGINCDSADINSIANAIKNLYLNKELRDQMSKNSRKLGEDLFNREETYNKIVNLLINH